MNECHRLCSAKQIQQLSDTCIGVQSKISISETIKYDKVAGLTLKKTTQDYCLAITT